MKWLNDKVRKAAILYAEAILEACEKAKVTNHLHAITDTDFYPRLQRIPEVEFAVGWLHGCADVIGVKIEVLWAQIEVELASKTRRKAVA